MTSLNKHLSKLEKNLAKIEEFKHKGIKVSSFLNDAYLDIKELGDYLKSQADNNSELDQELAEINDRYKALVIKFQLIADEINMQDKGMVMASSSTLPDFFIRITSRYQTMWKFFEQITTVFGIGMIGFTIVGLTYFLSFGSIPFIQFNGEIISGINALVFLLGIILGLCVHEFAHGVVLANNGIKIKRVGAMAGSMIGGFVEADEDTFFQADSKVHLRFNASSIGTNALLAVMLFIIAYLTSSELFLFLALGNLFFGFINSFPISPLDGGWVYEDLVKLYVTSNKGKKIFLSARFVIFIIWLILFVRIAFLGIQ